MVGSRRRTIRGTFPSVKVEAGGRIVAPKRWREASSTGEWVGCPWPLRSPQAIGLFPLEAWESRYDHVRLKMSQAAETDDEEAQLELERIKTLMDARAEDLKVDKVGRLCLGGTLCSFIGLDTEAVLIGAGDFFRVLSPAGYAKERQRQEVEISEQRLRRLQLTN